MISNRYGNEVIFKDFHYEWLHGYFEEDTTDSGCYKLHGNERMGEYFYYHDLETLLTVNHN